MKIRQKRIHFLEILKRKISSYFWLDNCAGGICIRERRGAREILCILHRDGGYMLPKGRVKKGETLPDGALREFREETGLYSSKIGDKIATVRDRIRRKKITFYWIYETGSKHANICDEAIMWIQIEKAYKGMKHQSEKKFLSHYIL